MATVEALRKDGTRRMADRLGIQRPGKAPKIAEAEHDDFVLAAILDAKNEATAFSQKRVAKVLGVTTKTLKNWAGENGVGGWDFYCLYLLERAARRGVSYEAATKKARLLRHRIEHQVERRLSTSSENETGK
jgi:hypothetical protein